MNNFKIFLLVIISLITSILNAQRKIEIVIEGNNFISDSYIKSKISLKDNDKIDFIKARQDAQKISEIYMDKSYFNVKVNQPQIIPIDTEKARVVFIIQELERIKIDSISFVGNKYFSSAKINNFLGFIDIKLMDFNKLRDNILELYSSRSFLFAKLEFALELKENKTILEIEIDEGKICRFENVYFRGNKITKDKTLLKISKFRRLNHFSLNNLLMIKKNLLQKKYIKSVEIIPLNSKEILFEIIEGRMTYFSGIIGMQRKENENKITGFMNVDFQNILGTDRALSFKWQQLPQDNQFLIMKYHDPGFWLIEGDLQLIRNEVDSTYIETSIASDVYYEGIKNRFGIHVSSDKIIPGVAENSQYISRYSSYKIGSFFLFDSTNNLHNPLSGQLLNISHNYILKKKSAMFYQQSTEIRYSIYLQMIPKNVVSLNINGKHIYGDDVEELDYFKFGGAFSLRGYAENQFSSAKVGWINFEYRYLLGHDSRIYTFLDSGIFEHYDKMMMPNELLGFGFGIQLDSRLGIVSISYALQHFNHQLSNFSDGFIHFGIITDF